jgi:hypothetical protein
VYATAGIGRRRLRSVHIAHSFRASADIAKKQRAKISHLTKTPMNSGVLTTPPILFLVAQLRAPMRARQ